MCAWLLQKLGHVKFKTKNDENRGQINQEVKGAESAPATVDYNTTISQKLGDMLNAQKDSEQYNHNLYNKIALFFKRKGLKKLYRYWYDRAQEENTHYNWIIDRLEECSYMYDDTPNVKPVTQTWDNDDLVAPFKLALEVERDTTASILEICKAAFEECDYKTVCWLFDRLIPEQHEEETITLAILKVVEQIQMTGDAVDWLTKQDTILDEYRSYRPNPDRPTMDSDGDFDND